jgi:hypothetical protein
MPEPSVAGCQQPDTCSVELHRPCASGTHIKDEKMAAIHKALDECSAEHPVFYEDEVDIHLNPKIGADWQLLRRQKRVTTPG